MKQITCIVCPIGCRITADTKDGELAFTGNRCARGAEFAKTEITAPVRSLTTTVKTAFPGIPVLPVRTSGEVSKGMIPDIMRKLSKIVITEKIGIGGIVAAGILGTGCDIIATSNSLLEGKEY